MTAVTADGNGSAWRGLAYRLHLLGIGGGADEVLPGYLRAEELLRRAARTPFPKEPRGFGPKVSVSEALRAEVVDMRDLPWFERRQAQGEEAEAARTQERLVGEVNALLSSIGEAPGADGIGAGGMRLIISPALRPVPAICPLGDAALGRPIVAAGTEVSAELIFLAVAAMPFAEEVERRFERAPFAARRLATLMIGGSRIVRARPSDALIERVLVAVVRELLPPQHRQVELEKMIRKLVPELDQPPGEIERAIKGMGRRRADRVHRAWLRGFFVPRGMVLPGLSVEGTADLIGGDAED